MDELADAVLFLEFLGRGHLLCAVPIPKHGRRIEFRAVLMLLLSLVLVIKMWLLYPGHVRRVILVRCATIISHIFFLI